jgi:uncharacterized phiE125 gp8 family phage protein
MNPRIIEPPAALVAIADLRAHLKLEAVAGEHPDDALVLALAASAAAYCEHQCDRSFGVQTLELALDLFPGQVAIALPRGPVASVISIKYIDGAAVVQTIDPGAYTLDEYSSPPFVVPSVDTVWPDTLATINAVKLRYVAGADVLPPVIKSAILLLTAHWYENREAVATGSWGEIPIGVTGLLDTQRDYSRAGGA